MLQTIILTIIIISLEIYKYFYYHRLIEVANNAGKIETSLFHDEMEFNNALCNKVHDSLRNIINITGADRVVIYEYYQGSRSVNKKLSRTKINITFEALRTGEEPSIMSSFQAVPASQYSKALGEISVSKLGYTRIWPNTTDVAAYTIQVKYGIMDAYNFRIGSTIWDGCLQASWIDSQGNLTDETLAEVRKQVDAIYGYFMDFK